MFYYDIIQEMNGRKAQRTNEKASAFIEKMKTVGNESMNYRNVRNPWKSGRNKRGV